MRVAFFSAALLASGAALAAAPLEGWYGNVFGGYSYWPDNISSNRFGLALDRAISKPGYNVGTRIGFKSTPLRYEGEFTFIQANLDHFYINDIRHSRINGSTSAALGMANIYYDFPDMVPGVQPFLGVGLGYGRIDGTIKSFYPLPSRFGANSSVFAYQATGGFTFNFCENYALDLAYRYVGTTRINTLGKMFQANLATFGVTYRFNDDSYK